MKILRLGKTLQRWVLSLLLPAFAMMGSPLQANPAGGVVVHGLANINQVSATHLNINQQSQTAIINWQDFSIGAGELTSFTQPNSAASVLNRVTSGNISQIYGTLQGNGNVYVVNPNGIVIGASGVIDVGGMAVISTLDIDDSDFLDGGANRFYGDTDAGVTNMGVISSASGDVILLGGFVDNQGQIGALKGTVALGSGGDIILQEAGGSKISVRGSSDYTGTGVNNADGAVIEGASAELKSHGNVYALAINNGGAIRASSATRSGGRVRLTSSGTSGNINLGQTSEITATAAGQGGDVAINASSGDVSVGGSTAAVGTVRGGSVSVGGSNVTQTAGSNIDVSGGTDGGEVVVDAVSSMTVNGAIAANGTYGSGGDVRITGTEILLDGDVDIAAEGLAEGGEVRIGGDFQGRDTGMREAEHVGVGRDVKISVNSELGDAGTAIVWSNDSTIFLGEVYAQSQGIVGNGGLIEISGLQNLYHDGIASANALNGNSGTVLFDPGDVTVGAAGTPPSIGLVPTTDVFSSTISIASVNDTLQGGTNVLIVTESGRIIFEDGSGGGFDGTGNAENDRDLSVQWTHSGASFGAFASESIFVNNHIRTSGGGSINLLAGWSGTETDQAVLNFDPQTAWDFYMATGAFGEGGGSVVVGSNDMNRHVIVGSRFGDTNVAGFDVRVYGSDTQSYNRFGQIGFNDMGNVFAPRLNNSGGIILDLSRGAGRTADWYLSDGLNDPDNNNVLDFATSIPKSGVGSPIVAVVGREEVDINDDGIMDGVRGLTSAALDQADGTPGDGVLDDTFIPYANHFDSAGYGNWWWQQIEDAGSSETKDPRGLGGLRPEHGAGIGDHSTIAKLIDTAGGRNNGADINVIARGNVLVEAGSGREHVSAMIGHGGNARASWGGANGSTRDRGPTDDENNARFSDSGIEGGNLGDGQLERRWSINGATNDRIAHSIGRLAPVYGNINVLAGVDPELPNVNVSHLQGTVRANIGTGGNIVVRGASGEFETSNESFNSFAMIGHGGIGQFGEFYGDIRVEAGGGVEVEAGNATRSFASIGHGNGGHSYWAPPSNADQQIRFFATTNDFDNPNLMRGELFTGRTTTGFDPDLDPLNQQVAFFNDLVPGVGGGVSPVIIDALVPGIGAVSLVQTGAFTVQELVDNWNTANPTKPINLVTVGVGGDIPDPGAEILFSSSQRRDSNYIDHITQGLGDDFAPELYTRALGGGQRGSLELAPLGPEAVEALDGSVITGYHGDVTVTAHAGSVEVTGYSTDIQPDDLPLGGNPSVRQERGRDRRFAGIGHGGSNFGFWTEGSGYDNTSITQDQATFTGTITGVTGPVTLESIEVGVGTIAIAGDGSTDLSTLVNGWNTANPGKQVTLTSANGGDTPAAGEIIRFSSTVGQGSENREVVVWEVGDGVDTAARSIGGNERTERPRSVALMTITGDISVDAGGDVSVVAGNDIYDYARIGHGGNETGDYETSSFILGDIQVKAGGSLLVKGGGDIVNNARFDSQRNFDTHAWAIIGHGGFRNGFMGYNGDIDVDVDGDVTVTGGAYTNTGAKIGHQTWEDFGQSGGDFNRTENFMRDENMVDIVSTLTSAEAKVEYDFSETVPFDGTGTPVTAFATRSETRDFTANGVGTAIGERNTANITVRAGGAVTVDQLDAGVRATPSQIQYEVENNITQLNIDNEGQGVRTRFSYAMIGHGGRATDSLNEFNPNANYGDKVGDVTVTADTGNILLQNSDGRERWTRIGHGFARARANGSGTVFSRSIELAGNITVTATEGDVIVDAAHAEESEQDYGTDVDASDNGAVPSRENAVAIGHGSVIDSYDVVVLSNGEIINGIAASSDITVTAGGNMEILGGNGIQGSHAQVGHGWASDQGNDRSRRFNQATGFAGDINVSVMGDLTLKGGENAWIELPSATEGVPGGVSGGFAAIGHGGYQLDAPSEGNITVYVGNNLSILGQVRVEGQNDAPPSGAFYTKTNGDPLFSDRAGSVFNFAKIGHFAVENSDRRDDNGDIVTESDQSGNITVVVGNDLTMKGGTSIDIDSAPIWGAFAQIGNGGPGAAGDLDGDITVLVKGNIDMEAGEEITSSGAPGGAIKGLTRNNYVMIGNGDRIFEPGGLAGDIFRTEAIGFRTGNIVVAAGNDAAFKSALVGHADPALSSQTTIGNTQVAVSRLNPFYGGTGILSSGPTPAGGGLRTVFSGDTMQFFMPARSNNQLLNPRINGTAYAGGSLTDFADDPAGGFDSSLGELAGRGDEVYLTPDLWWDDAGVAAAAGVTGADVFPTDAASGQGGAIAEVNFPGGLFNLDTLTAGALGASVTTSNTALGNYTVYYDAVEVVSNSLPIPPEPPFIGFWVGLDTTPFFFLDQFDSFTRDDGFVEDEVVGGDDFLYASLGLFETDEDAQEESGSRRLENGLDNLFGSSRDSTSEEEEDEEKRKLRKRGAGPVGGIGLTFYTFEPGTNFYSSYRVFGTSLETFIPEN